MLVLSIYICLILKRHETIFSCTRTLFTKEEYLPFLYLSLSIQEFRDVTRSLVIATNDFVRERSAVMFDSCRFLPRNGTYRKLLFSTILKITHKKKIEKYLHIHITNESHPSFTFATNSPRHICFSMS